MTPITLYHNPQCGTSRQVLALLQARGLPVQVVEYLKTPPSRDTLRALAAATGQGVRGLLRSKQAEYQSLGLDNPALDDEALLDALHAHPILLNRPVLVTALGACVARPAERALDVLPPA